MKRILALIITMAVTLSLFPFKTAANDMKSTDSGAYEAFRFDLGGAGVENGYIGVSAQDAYNAQVGYGFANINAVENVAASGKGALSDAVRFKSDVPNHIFNVDLPSGVYKITVTTGDVKSTTINAEGWSQLFFLTGSNAVDTFTIPVTDGQLNIYAGSGVGTEFSLSTIEIEQTSTGTTTKPTIWVGGDSTAASYYNVSEDAARGWGQYLCNHVDMNEYDIRNISASGITSSDLNKALFGTIEHYGKSGDILLLAVGINDYTKAYKANPDAPDPTDYITYMTDMVQRAKAKGMTVYLVKQHGQLNDCAKYPLIQKRWFSDSIDEIAAAEQVEIIDLFHPWLTFCLESTYTIVKEYYTADGLHLNLSGADKMAQMINEQLFPPEESGDIVEDPYKDFDIPSTVYYHTEVSGGPVPNPHKGYVMTVYNPDMFESAFPYGIGGSMDNHAWDVVTICNGVHYWEDINPQEGVYNWKEINDMLDACEKHGMTYVIRILPYSHLSGSHANYGEAHDFVPQWVYDKGAKKKRVTLLEDPSVALDVPVWDDEIYLQACKDFATALGEHFDGDPRVEFLDIRPFGNWGEWHFSQVTGSEMPSVEIQKDMLKHYKDAFDQTLLAVPSNAWGEVYEYALSIGVAKRDDGLIASSNREWGLRLSYKSNLPALAENAATYSMMLENENGPYGPLKWTPQRFRECIEIAHLTATALDQDSQCGYKIYTEQKELVDEMVNRMGYNFTVTSAKRNDNQLLVTIKNTGLAPAFFNIELCAEITDKNGNKLKSFGKPVIIEKGSFHDEEEKTFLFEYDGSLDENATICLAMYDSDNPLVKGKNPTVKFDNMNTLSTNRLLLIEKENCTAHTDSDKDNKCDNCGALLIGAKLVGYTLSLNGNIGVNFFMELDDTVANDDNAYMLFTLPNGTTKKIAVSDAIKDTTISQGKTYYVFTCEVSSFEMSQQIKARMFDGNDNGGIEYTYTVRDYAEYIISHAGSYTEGDVAFASALLNYGAASQTLFDSKTDDLANKNLSAAEQVITELDAKELEDYISYATSGEVGTFAGYNLVLESETTLKAYFKPQADSYTNNLIFTINGEEAVAEKSGTYYVVSVENIKAWDLDTTYIFKATDGKNELTFEASAMSYAYSVLNAGDTYSSELRKLVCALREYQLKSEIYCRN